MDKRNDKFWIIGGVVLVIDGLPVSVFGLLPRQSGDPYKDTQVRLAVQVDYGRTASTLELQQKEYPENVSRY